MKNRKLFFKKTIIINILTAFLVICLCACKSETTSDSVSKENIQMDTSSVEIEETEDTTFIDDDFCKIKSEIALLLGYLYEYDDYSGHIDYFKMDEFESGNIIELLETYLSYEYLHSNDSDLFNYDYDKKIISGTVKNLKDLYSFFSCTDLNSQDIEEIDSLNIKDDCFEYTPRAFEYLFDVDLICTEQIPDGYRLVLNAKSGSEISSINYNESWIVDLKANDSSGLGYYVFSVERFQPDMILDKQTMYLYDSFYRMKSGILSLIEESNITDRIDTKDIMEEELINMSLDFDNDRLYPVYLKQQDRQRIFYVNHMFDLGKSMEYKDSWEIVFEEDESSALGIRMISIAPIIDTTDDCINENYLMLLEDLQEISSNGTNKAEGLFTAFIDNREYLNYLDKSTGVSHALADIDGDGIPELIIRNHLSEFQDYSFYVFKSIDGIVSYLNSDISRGGYYDTLYFSPSNKALVSYSRTSTNLNYYFYKVNEKGLEMDYELCWERDYDSNGAEVVNYYYVKNDNYELFNSIPYGQQGGEISGWDDRISDFEEIYFSDLN